MPHPEGNTATVMFTDGPTITVYGPELHRPALPASGGPGYAEFSGYIRAGLPDIPWPTATARIEQPGTAPYEATGANVDISCSGRRMDYLKLIWRTAADHARPVTQTVVPSGAHPAVPTTS
ncbi:hypothetical protein ACFWJY_00560 [Streptomyces anulatus]|uniref:hypothetical protein n=1 Tax=Streptomyces anulatus TaxID=1892 RepID=UPI0036571583